MNKQITCPTCKEKHSPYRRNGIPISKYCKPCKLERDITKREKENKRKAKERGKIRRAKKREKKANSKSVLTKRLDAVFSQFIRQRDKGVCISCGKKRQWKEQQAGHYIRRSNMNMRWDEENVHCQCVADNIFKSGAYPEYTIALQNKYGYDIVRTLIDRANKIKKWKTQELKDKIKYYENKLNETNI